MPDRSKAGSQRFTAVVLAGIRPGGDPLAAAYGVPRKALIPVGGVAMIARVLAALRGADCVDQIAICGLDRATLASCQTAGEHLVTDDLLWLAAAANPSESVVAALDELGTARPLLVTTGDHPLLTPAIVDFFCKAALAARGDVAAGVVDAVTVRAAYPDAQRTFYPLRDAAYTGCNMFAFIGAEGRRAAQAWLQVERHRKRPWRVVALLGPQMLVRFFLRRLTLDDALASLSQRLGVRARAIRMRAAEAGIDVDKQADVDLVESILAARERSG